MFYAKSNTLPLPSDPRKTVTYSGGIVFYE